MDEINEKSSETKEEVGKVQKITSINECEDEDKYRIYASVSFMVVVIIIGVPMWWKTTEVYRVPLPYKEIENFKNMPLKVSLNVGIFTFDPNYSNLLIDELRDYYKNNGVWNINFTQILMNDNTLPKTPAMFEKKLLQIFKLNIGDFIIYEWPKLSEEDILVTSDRSAIITNTTSSSKIFQLLDFYVLQNDKVDNIINEDKYGFKISPPQPEYDVFISVLNPFPEKMNINWNVAMASEIYLKPFFEKIRDVSNFILKIQWRYQVEFDVSMKPNFLNNSDIKANDKYYTVSKESLPHIITSIEKYLGQSISDNFRINIVIYVPPCSISPLYIHDKVKRISSSSSSSQANIDTFISQNWGCVLIYNPPQDKCKLFDKISFNINSNDVMQIILYNLQKLLDIDTNIQTEGIKFDDHQQIAPRTWEYEAFIRRSTINYIITANRTLQSLIQLLDNISYIVINDDVGKSVNNAYEKILKAKDSLELGNLLDALKFAKDAFLSSERAFFDASLLAQLYFPDEQKYAVYIPLFLPIMVPVITSIAALKKFYMNKSNKENLS